MTEKTLIEWTATYHPDGSVTPGSTVNFWMGCKKVSPACAHCYMFRDMRRYGRNPDQIVRTSDATFYAPLKWREGRKIFTCSWSDFFIEDADPWRADAWDVIRRTPHHTWLILTKRTERIAACLPPDWGQGWPWVWLGATVESQRWVERIPQLLAVPAVVRFLSCEPLLGPVDLTRWLPRFIPWANAGGPNECSHGYAAGIPCPDCTPRLHWVIGGGESGPDARPTHPDWARGLRDQCQAAGVPFFWKQWGEWVPEGDCPYFNPDTAITLNRDGTATPAARGPYPAGHRTMHHVGKHRAGRRLDGREHNAMPEVAVHA